VIQFVSQLLAIAGKDLRLEPRSRERLMSMLVFAVLVGGRWVWSEPRSRVVGAGFERLYTVRVAGVV
jgi:hypothetical protein